MKNILFTTLMMVTAGTVAYAQCPFNLTLQTQAQVDKFPSQYPGCSIIPGTIIVQSGPNINNLNGLSSITFVLGDVRILNNDNLTSLNGLQNLTGTGNKLEIINNDMLTDLQGLNGILGTGDDLTIDDNDNLTSLSGLQQLTTVAQGLTIANNDNLNNVNALSSLTGVTGAISIFQNDQLSSLDGLNALFVAGSLLITTNPTLSDCANQGICRILNLPGISATITNNTSGCNSVNEVLNACMSVNVHELELHPLLIAPNPASDWVRIQGLDASEAKLEIFNATGQLVLNKQVQNEMLVSVHDLNAGSYQLIVKTNNAVYRAVMVKE